MSNRLKLVLALHNHQPIGNFDGSIEQAYQDSYLPFLNLFRKYESLKIVLHTSGSLMDWLEAQHPEYVDALSELASSGRIEILGGPYYEPILAMLPSRDRIGQIRRYTNYLEKRLKTRVRGIWTPERVWEQAYIRDLTAAGIEYTIVDDFHFKKAGLLESQLYGRYLSEDDGNLMTIFPGSERLRYYIPFHKPQDTIDYCRHIFERNPNGVVVFGDDGEKFGTWPDTKKHVYEDGWLDSFFQTILANSDWLDLTTLSACADEVRPVGKIYLPDCSYREMTEWVLPAERQWDLDEAKKSVAQLPEESQAKVNQFIKGGFWRNFKIKYPETNEMYSRMMEVSSRLEHARQCGAANRTGKAREIFLEAEKELYRGQCNCSYWHGAFGGCYLPHLRNAVYHSLIRADNLLDSLQTHSPSVEAHTADYNLDGQSEIRLSNNQLSAYIEPDCGGRVYELDVRSICHNLLATLSRRPEAYHKKVAAGASANQDECASIHDRVVFKQEGLEKRLQYDVYERKSFIDLFFAPETDINKFIEMRDVLQGDFYNGSWDAVIRRKPGRIQVKMTRQGMACGHKIQITKGLTLNEGSSTLEAAYLLENLPTDAPLHFGVELNFAGMPAGCDDRYYFDEKDVKIDTLGAVRDFNDNRKFLGLKDEWLGLSVGIQVNEPTRFWTFPIQTVSASEGGFEAVHQSVCVVPNWVVVPDSSGKWVMTMKVKIDSRQ